jgi:hypothetical protein
MLIRWKIHLPKQFLAQCEEQLQKSHQLHFLLQCDTGFWLVLKTLIQMRFQLQILEPYVERRHSLLLLPIHFPDRFEYCCAGSS